MTMMALGNLEATGDARQNADSLQTISYPGIVERVPKLLSLVSRYKFEDVCRAAFCINSWHQNRSAQECAISLNASLAFSETFGAAPIVTYDEFKTFYAELERLNPVSPIIEDYVIPIMGHTKVYFQDKWWPALYGCGMVHEYSRLCFANSICLKAQKVDEFESLLTYTNSMIAALDRGGWNGKEESEIALYLPSESHWNNTNAWFDEATWFNLPAKILEVLSDKKAAIECVHFVVHNEKVRPLFNPSILSDCLRYCCDSIEKRELTGVVDSQLAYSADSIFNDYFLEDRGLILWPRFKLSDKYIENCPVLLMLFDENCNVTIFYDLHFGDGNIKELRKALLGRCDEVKVYESVEREAGYRGLSFGRQAVKEVNLVAFTNDVAPLLEPKMIEASSLANVTCGALDLLSIFHASSSIEEINAFFSCWRRTGNRFHLGIAGAFPHFWSWKSGGRNILSGAEDARNPVNIFADYNDNDWYYCDFFGEEIADYPYLNGTYPFGSPFRFNFRKGEEAFTSVIPKTSSEIVRECKRLDGGSSYLQICADRSAGEGLSAEELEKEVEAYNLAQDILMKLVNSLEREFSALAKACNGILQFEYVCYESDDALNLNLVDGTLGIRAQAARAPFGRIRFTFNRLDTMAAIMDASSRSVECQFGSAVVSALGRDCSAGQALAAAILSRRSEEKLVDVTSVRLPYAWRRNTARVAETDASKTAAIKTVALIVDGAGIRPGIYKGKEANQLLRQFQDGLTSVFKKKLGDYKAESLIEDLYEACGSSSHEFYMHTRRFEAFTKIDQSEAQRLKSATLELREEARTLTRAARYCVETILAFNLGSEEEPSTADLAYLLSLSVQCLGLNDIADMLHFNPEGISIRVEDNKTIEVLEEDKFVSKSRNIKLRSLVDPGHNLKDDSVDINYLKRSKIAFEKDTGVSLECLMSVLDELAFVEQSETFSFVRPNVAYVSKKALTDYLGNTLEGCFAPQAIFECIDFLTLDNTSLNIEKGKPLDYVPFGQIKNRPNRFELNPLLLFDKTLVFSPICCGILKLRWLEGVTQRFLPTKAYTSLQEVSEQWKRHYEKALENDTRDLFLAYKFDRRYVFKGLELCKRGKHPRNLGDYDGLAYDAQNEVLWCIECKEFEKVESAFDSFQLQARWFGKNGKLLKFDRRIRYLKEHLEQVATDLGFPYSESLTVKSYVVCNKLFMNMLGDSEFEVITLNELEEMLRNANSQR